MIKRILVPLDSSSYSRAAVDYACLLAKQHKARLTGLAVLNLFGIHKTLGHAPVGGMHYYKKLESFKIKEAEAHIKSLREEFSKKCQALKVPFQILEGEGRPSSHVLEEGKFHDLIVIGMRTHFRLGSKQETSNSTERILDHSVTPKYLIPSTGGIRKQNNKVLVLLDESQPSGRAVQRYCQFALPSATDAVKIVMSARNEETTRRPLEAAGELFRVHGFRKVETLWVRAQMKTALTEGLAGWADLIVAGPNQESEVINFKFGNLTKFLIKMEKRPLFLG